MLVSPAEFKAHIGVSDSADDAELASVLLQAEAVLGARYAMPTVPVTASTIRTSFADGCLLYLNESVIVTAIADTSGNALAFTAVPGGVLLDSWHLGFVNVTGTWGYASTPADVTRAILVTAETLWKRRTYGSDDAPYRGGGDAIPKEAAQIMDARRTVRF